MPVATTSGLFPLEDFLPLSNKIQGNQDKPVIQLQMPYLSALRPKGMKPPMHVVPRKPVIMLHGELWKSSEVKTLIIQENLQYAIICKFSYRNLDIMKLRKTTPG